MHQTPDRVARAMRDRPAPAVTLGELVRTLAEDGRGPGPDPQGLVNALRRCPDRFRVFDSMRGPWAATDQWLRPAQYVEPLLEQGVACEPWIVALEDLAFDAVDDSSPQDTLSRRTRQSLVWLARGVDEGSPAAVNRWCRLLGEDRRFQAHRRRHRPVTQHTRGA